jgi:hypothetical protein
LSDVYKFSKKAKKDGTNYGSGITTINEPALAMALPASCPSGPAIAVNAVTPIPKQKHVGVGHAHSK